MSSGMRLGDVIFQHMDMFASPSKDLTLLHECSIVHACMGRRKDINVTNTKHVTQPQCNI